jgi:hypothetical protein
LKRPSSCVSFRMPMSSSSSARFVINSICTSCPCIAVSRCPLWSYG